MEEAICPFCLKPIRSDANFEEFCTICAMGITKPEIAPKWVNEEGKRLYFCCDWCLRIYMREIKGMRI
jgi:hypothetical protein